MTPIPAAAAEPCGPVKQRAPSCIVSDWEEWSACQYTCGSGGDSKRTRIVLNGVACTKPLQETRLCNQSGCPEDCQWEDWREWDSCSQTCGAGQKHRKRGLRKARFGGLRCVGHPNQTADCEDQQCPNDCTMGPWGDWFACSKSCSGGTAKRFRKVEVEAVGQDCKRSTEQSADCCNEACPVDCQLADWSPWTECTHTCGDLGKTDRSRKVEVVPANGGLECGPKNQSKPCNVDVQCPVNCEYSDWSEWKSCSVTCGSGTRNRFRIEITPAVAGGKECSGQRQDVESCSMDDCPTDCEATDWSDWSACTTSCGSDGVQERSRTLTSFADNGGKPCPHGNSTLERKACNELACPVDCEWAEWQNWRLCSATCGWGQSLRMRLVKTPPSNGGAECDGNQSAYKECLERQCPQHCLWQDWEEWSGCSKTCGGGTKKRLRLDHPEKYGGVHCEGTATQEVACSPEECPIDCKWGDWSEWKCQASCAPGQQKRNRILLEAPQNGGAACHGPETETAPCANLPICPIDCQWSDWEDWSDCSASCGPGTRKRLRNRTAYEKHGGHVCYGTQDDEAICTAGECPEACVVGDWGHWSACPVTCGIGQHTRTRKVQSPAKNGGADCACDLLENKSCAIDNCPVNCEFTDWGDWTPCPKSCGGAIKSRERKEKTLAQNGGNQCEGGVKEDYVCQERHCPVDCELGSWSPWGVCSATCGGGVRKRGRAKVSLALFGGLECEGNLTGTEPCNEDACAVDCVLGPWTSWSECTKECGGGTTKRNRTMTKALNGGTPCAGTDKQESTCNTEGCAQDCKWGMWTQWTPCSKLCGGGKTKRFRDVLEAQKNNGTACTGDVQEEVDCNIQSCAIDCVYSEWTAWSACDKSCNGGVMSRSRYKMVEDQFGGKACDGDSQEKKQCDHPPCPLDCEFSPWGDWGECTSSCGKGIRYKTRKREEGRFGGAACVGGLIGSDDCVAPLTTGCPQFTTVSTTELTIGNITEVLDAWLAGKSSSWDAAANGSDPQAPCSTEELQNTISKYEDSKAMAAKAKAKAATEHRHQGKLVASTVSGNLVLYAENPAAISQSGTAKVGMERTIARLAGVDSGAVEVTFKVPTEKELAEVNQKEQGNTVVEYTIYLYKGELFTPTAVSKAIAAESSAAVTAEMKKELLGPDFAAMAISMSLRVTRNEQ
eukprot:CAMPEP_0197667352 /NCGR_PEP_ID=MMETSP1338-20131121/66005_1 /TAXON_ID=43686 ORGANISM="Pelagodinium beii, Strain RCC1491" /NCGR_SAMPLE_ID=MMETSP1338 /ASSEMBLY_ACC=CAM_ASM_000754 /LENGTH=1174 /DNA_ID=CAMNT_0043246569 /DNA_START=290 /DNA_END=3814 /DNA_ORIENTATION=-